MARLLQDRNWPGAIEAIELFRLLGREISVPYIEKECEEAIQCNDVDWLEHVNFSCDSLGIKEDFSNPKVYLKMMKAAEDLN